MTEAFLGLTKVVKGVTDDKTNFKRRILVSFIKSTSKESIFPEMQWSKDLFFQQKKRERGMCLKGIAGYANRVMEYQL